MIRIARELDEQVITRLTQGHHHRRVRAIESEGERQAIDRPPQPCPTPGVKFGVVLAAADSRKPLGFRNESRDIGNLLRG